MNLSRSPEFSQFSDLSLRSNANHEMDLVDENPLQDIDGSIDPSPNSGTEQATFKQRSLSRLSQKKQLLREQQTAMDCTLQLKYQFEEKSKAASSTLSTLNQKLVLINTIEGKTERSDEEQRVLDGKNEVLQEQMLQQQRNFEKIIQASMGEKKMNFFSAKGISR